MGYEVTGQVGQIPLRFPDSSNLYGTDCDCGRVIMYRMINSVNRHCNYRASTVLIPLHLHTGDLVVESRQYTSGISLHEQA